LNFILTFLRQLLSVQKNIFDIHFFEDAKSTAKQVKTFTFAASK